MLDFFASRAIVSSIVAVLLSSLLLERLMFSFKNKLPLLGKNVYIAGGSQGLGLSLACLLAGRGANVTIVARNQGKLDEALQEIEKYRQNPSQKFHNISADLISHEGTGRSFDAYAELNNVPVPNYVFCCAGGAGAVLGLFADLTPDQLQQGMKTNYDTALWTAHAASKRMVEHGVKGKIVFVSSLVGFFSFAGYSAYSPAKYALRGLADALRNEFLLYGITVHCYFPGTIFTPGYAAETETKPELTKTIEGPEEGNPPEKLAVALLKGLERGQFLVTSDPIGHLFRNGTRGVSPAFHGLVDIFWYIAALVGIPVWRMIADGHVVSYAKKYKTQKSM